MTQAPAASLVLDDLRLHLDGRLLVALDAVVAPGEILTVMGPSGSGKSSLLAALAGFLRPPFTLSGRVLLGGQDVGRLPPQRRQVGLMFQSPLLFPHMSVGENLMFALAAGGTVRARRHEVEAALADAGLDGFYDRATDTLSGGQQSRVALIRVLLSKPRALLLDEPFSSLDTMTRAEMRQLVFSAARSAGLPVVLVTHDLQDAQAAGGPVITLDGDGAQPAASAGSA